MKITTETGLTVLSRMMTFDQNNSQQLFENLRNQTIPPVAETHLAMNAKSIWKSEQDSRKRIAGLGKERCHWLVKKISLMILLWPRGFSSCVSAIYDSHKIHSFFFRAHHTKEVLTQSCLLPSIHS